MSKQRPARHGQSRSLAVSAWPLRSKVALAITIPLLLAATLGGLSVRNDLQDAANSSTSARQVTILRPAVAYLAAAERAMVAAQDTSDASEGDLEAAVQDVQDASAALTKTAQNADLTTDQRYQLDAMMDLSRAIRDANTNSLSAGTWIAQLRQLQSGVTQLITTIVNAQNDPEPRLELLSQTLSGRFSLSMQQALAATATGGGTSSQELFSELGVEGAAIDRLASAMGDSEPAIAALRTDNAQRTRIVRTHGDNLGGDEAYTQYDDLTTKLMNGIDDSLAVSASDARRSALISGGIVLGALLATILLAVLIARMLLNPIRKVREGARTVANVELPEAVARIRAGQDPGPITPIDVTTHEEVGQLARAVDELHRQAVTLAAGEARVRSQVSEMFITLSRRNTTLINQQLTLIETLEKDEEDPKRLESLFRLDHLAARMRRTADSLLVLADAPTHTSADDDLTVTSALQAATAGVQDYRRVQVGSSSTARISDAAAADVIHLVTELVDNALSYSDPSSTVVISSTTTPDGVSVAIEDTGLGIPDVALAEINKTLRNGADVTPDTARRMGLFVVSRLGQRHGIAVSLEQNSKRGTTAHVLLPTRILNVSTPAGQVAPPVVSTPVVATPAPQPTPTQFVADDQPLSLEDRLNGAMGRALPRRERGAQLPDTAPLAPLVVPAAEIVPEPQPEPEPERVVEPVMQTWPEPVAEPVEETTPETTPEPTSEQTPEPTSEVPKPLPVRGQVPVQASADDERPSHAGPTPKPAPLRTAADYVAAANAASSNGHGPELNGHGADAVQNGNGSNGHQIPNGQSPMFPPLAAFEAEAETPIFKALQSAWLNTDSSSANWRPSEVEAGWAKADAVAASLTDAPVSDAGLPMRRPGTRVVPGGVAKPTTVGVRDPEAIRKRLASYAAGVSRGRAAAESTTGQDPSKESQ